MAEAIYHAGDGVIEMNATNNGPTQFSKLPVRSVIVTGGTAGEFQVRMNNTTFSLRTAAGHLTLQFEIRMPLNEVELALVPAGGIAYLLLDQMP